ncbi:hypothetical protein AWM70_15970 [Paenibacillus yonginensis]|uniref:Uncharacterized protein n=1 Tax=Paenibacillus yonginensis TaxID=1462996 RepID=A0A1B1N3B6_9BACL|nr:endospore germination permease [Paenibacillus yonginensis]ANS75899.1 hypothetical protein AWM70_15970 [Paenibacillus yonginensis]
MKQKIGTLQASFLIVNAIVPTAIMVLPSIISTRLEQEGPFSIVISACFGVLLVFLIADLIKKSHRTPYIEWISKVSSPFVGALMGALIVGNFIEETAIVLRQSINFINENVLLNTPFAVILIIMVSIGIYITTQGIEVMARVSSILMLLYILPIPVYLSGVVDFNHFSRLLPIFEHSLNDYILSSLGPANWISEVSFLLYIAPYLKSPERSRSIGFLSLTFTCIIILIVYIPTLLAFGPEYIKVLNYPGVTYSKLVHLGRAFENLNILFVSYWLLVSYIKLSFFLFVTLECFKQTFRIKENQSYYLLALSLIIALESYYTWDTPAHLYKNNLENQFPGFMLFNVVFPLMVYVMSIISQLKTRRREISSRE